MEKKYWKSLEETNSDSVGQPATPDETTSKSLLELINDEIDEKPSSRRNFLKFCGFSFATAAIATSCKNPVQTAIPYLNKPEDVTPGMASHYATTYYDGQDYSSLVVKVRDGRPIKVEGNELSSFNRGGSSARVQASVLSLYDDGARYKSPLAAGKPSAWATVDSDIIAKLTSLQHSGKEVALITSTLISPSTQQVINGFKAKFPNVRHIIYDSVSQSAMLDANYEMFGNRSIPDFHFEKADTILSIGADFLGTWLSPVEFNRSFAESRRISDEKKTMSQLHVIESGLSLTGSNADYRYPVKPSLIPGIILNLYNNIATATGNSSYPAPKPTIDLRNFTEKLLASKGRALVVCGINNPSLQVITNAINLMLDSYSTVIDFGRTLLTSQGADRDIAKLLESIQSGTTGGVIFYNVNPVYDYAGFKEIMSSPGKPELSISFANAMDETSALCSYVCPDHHYLESWGDAEVRKGMFSLQQPTIRHIFDTRQVQDSLLKWSSSETDYHAFLKQYWTSNFYAKQVTYATPLEFWNRTLQDGVFELEIPLFPKPLSNKAAIDKAAATLNNDTEDNGIEVVFYETIAAGNGRHANNPWLMEMPDPISKVCWDNFAAISPSLADKLKISTGDMIRLSETVEIPAFVQPGQADGTLAIAYGYGREGSGSVAEGTGKNVFPLIQLTNGYRSNFITIPEVKISKNKYKLASTQMHHNMEGRAIVRETTLGEWTDKPDSGNEMHEKIEQSHIELYKAFEFGGHHWGMAIDLNACSGCSACVIGCQAENNVPVVGREQVAMTRIMHWIRIDRYYSDDPANPAVYFQPVMCQHCDNAPCENVCPVSATNHSNEGLNQMAYNRCIGTKYCINNCPYKVRRFNWFRYATNDKFNYNMNSDLGRMVLNPDVTVRERGVVEKCSFCVQRIQEKKLQAKLEGRQVKDGEIMPACAQACPSGAIIFGDLNDPESNIAKLFKDKRNYHLLEEIHTLPSVGYLTKVRNQEKAGDA